MMMLQTDRNWLYCQMIWIGFCGGPFVSLGFDLSYYTTAYDSKVGELGLA